LEVLKAPVEVSSYEAKIESTAGSTPASPSFDMTLRDSGALSGHDAIKQASQGKPWA
jgi:hypothetical protein